MPTHVLDQDAPGLAGRLRALEAADDRYLTLQEQGAPAEVWEKWFSLARLLRGMAVGFGAAHSEDIADAIYEIAKSVGNSARLFEQIASEIGALPEVN